MTDESGTTSPSMIYSRMNAEAASARPLLPSSTHVPDLQNMIVLQTECRVGPTAPSGVYLTVSPAQIEKRLAIRSLNVEIQGGPLANSTTGGPRGAA